MSVNEHWVARLNWFELELSTVNVSQLLCMFTFEVITPVRIKSHVSCTFWRHWAFGRNNIDFVQAAANWIGPWRKVESKLRIFAKVDGRCSWLWLGNANCFTGSLPSNYLHFIVTASEIRSRLEFRLGAFTLLNISQSVWQACAFI